MSFNEILLTLWQFHAVLEKVKFSVRKAKGQECILEIVKFSVREGGGPGVHTPFSPLFTIRV